MPHIPNLILPYILIMFGIVGLLRARAVKKDQKKRDDFFQKESEANSVKKRDISALPYIVPDEALLNTDSSDPKINELLSELKTFKDKKILNLTGISNTDLKLKYGTANITELSECDDNFTSYCKVLYSIGNAYNEIGDTVSARRFLEYAVGIRTDITDNYVLLANIYRDNNELNRIDDLINIAGTLNSLSKQTIILKLNDLVHT
ncbi:MAG: hypothetical protein IJR23_03175 [Lachnospiraceae bacterium]|nr:hypothetical protein [Lachnospiraceae bacterium]